MHMAYGLFHAKFIIYRTTPFLLASSSTTGTLFKVVFFFLLITCTLKHDLAAAFSTTSLTELEQNYFSGLVNLFAEIPKYFYFV